jgi:hypothetical protein
MPAFGLGNIEDEAGQPRTERVRPMKTIILAAAVVALTLTSVRAQDAGGMGGAGGRHHGQQQKDTKATPPKPKVDEKAYNAALKGIPNKPYDAWSGVR